MARRNAGKGGATDPVAQRGRWTAAEILRHQVARERWPGVTLAIDGSSGRYWFDEDEARRAVEFAPDFLRHLKGELGGQPIEYLDWAKELVVRPLFGWKRTSDGLRRFRKVFVLIPKKNTKSLLCSGIGLYLLHCDEEKGKEIFAAACDREQAGIVFGEARDMNEASPELAARSDTFRRAIVVPTTGSSFRVVSSDVRSKHGPNLHGLIFDEFHGQPNRELYDTLSKGVASRRQPVTLIATTAGDDQESICYEEYERAKRIISGADEEETLLPVIFEAKLEEDWRDPKTWERVNPGLGLSLKRDYLEAECRAAIAEPRKQNSFKRLHLNVWTNQYTAWIPIEDWDACRVEAIEEPEDAPAFAGLDLSSKLDLTALVVVVLRPEVVRAPVEIEVAVHGEDGRVVQDDDGRAVKRLVSINYTVDVHPFFWVPEESMQRRAKEDGVPFDRWEDEGEIRVTPGNVVDYDAVMQDAVTEILPRFRGLREVDFDPWGGTQFALQLQARGLKVVEVTQTVKSLSEPAKVFEALIRSKRLRHAGNKAMRWCVSNVAVREDKNGNIFPTKSHRKKRIDGVAATITALSRAIVEPLDGGLSPYEEHGLEVFG